MMKKNGLLALTTILALTASLALTGCADKDSGSPDSGTSAVPQATLTFWAEETQQALYEGAYKEIIAVFEKENSDIKIDIQWSGSFDSLTVAVQTDSLPDVFFSQGNKMTSMAEMVQNGYVLSLSDYNVDTSRFPQDSIDYSTIDGKIYCSLPSFLDYALIYYNADIFKANNVSPPKTWDEFVTVCETLSTANVLPMAYGGNGWLDRYWLIGAMAPAFFEQDMLALKSGGTVTDFSKITECFTEYYNLVSKDYLGKNFAATDAAGAQLTFTNGGAAMFIDGTWNSTLYKDINIGCFALHGKDGKGYAQTGPSQSTTFSASAKTKFPEQAARFVNFWNTQQAAQIMSNHVPMIPVVDDIEITNELISQMADFDVIGQNLFGVLSFAGNDNSQPADLFVNDILPKLMMGDYTPEKATELLQAELNK